VAGNTVQAYAALADVCLVDALQPMCAPLACSNRVRGWLGRTCLKYVFAGWIDLM
jgi:hypothetical protein